MAQLTRLLMTPTGLAFDRLLVRYTGESLLNRVFARQAGFPPQPALLLETRGRASGERRQAVLPWFLIDGKWVVVGSKGGMPSDPAWVHNLRADPAVGVHVARRHHRAQARVTTGAEREVLWSELVARVPVYAHYQSLTTREIPVVVLDFSACQPCAGSPS